MFASRNPDDAFTSAAPMYITVGPQGCGKTTFLKKLHPQLLDISLDDQPDVYIPVNTTIFLNPTAITTTTTTTAESDTSILDTIYHGKSLLQRIRDDNTELHLILKLWKGELSPQNFAIDLLVHYQQKKQPVQIAQALIRTLQKSQYTIPEQIQIFVVESLFRPHPATQRSAIQRAYTLLRTTPSHIPVAWGNTNSKPRDYQMALEIACQTRRPVHFLISAPLDNTTLPWLPLSSLLERNLQRFSETGKYIPAIAIAECTDRVEGLFAKNKGMDAFSREQYLVHLAEPYNNNGHRNNTTTYRYRLTRNRLIQKEFLSSHYPQPPRENHRRPPLQTRKGAFQSSTGYQPAHKSERREGHTFPNNEDRYQRPTDHKRPRTNQYSTNRNTTHSVHPGNRDY